MQVTRWTPLVGTVDLTGDGQLFAVALVDTPTREEARQASLLLLGQQTGVKTFAGTATETRYGDTRVKVRLVPGEGDAAVIEISCRGCGHLADTLFLRGTQPLHAVRAFLKLHDRQGCFSLTVGVAGELCLDLLDLVKYDLVASPGLRNW